MVERKGIQIARNPLTPRHPSTAEVTGTPSGTPCPWLLWMDGNGCP